MAYKKTPLIYDKFPYKLWAYWSLAVVLVSLSGIYYYSPFKTNPGAIPQSVRDAITYLKDLVVYAAKTKQVSATFDQANSAALRTAIMALTAPVAVLFPFVIHLVAFTSKKPNESRFARPNEIKRIGLDGDLGPVIGLLNGDLLKAHEPRHVVEIAPNRAGKTRQAVTAVLDYPGSVIVIDPKEEIEGLTIEYRETLGPIHKMAVADPNTPDGYNYFARSHVPDDMVERELAASRFAATVIPEEHGAKDSHWRDTAYRNLTALALFEMCEAKRQDRNGHARNLINYIQELPDANEKIKDPFAAKMSMLAAIAERNGYPKMITDDLVSFAATEVRERSAHISTLLTKLQMFRLEASQAALGLDTFDFQDFRDNPGTLYISYPQKDAAAFGPLVALFLDTLFSWGLSHPRQEGEYPIFIAWDEFRDAPAIEQLPSMFTRGASAGFSIMLIVQTMQQIKERYPHTWHNIAHNIEHWVLFEMPDIETAKMMGEVIGKTTVDKRSKNYSSGKTSKSVSEVEEFLITPKEFALIPFGYHIVIARRHQLRPILCKTAFWDKIRPIRRLVPRHRRRRT